MKTISKYSNYFGLALALCVMIFSGCSCSTTKTDPLVGWKILFSSDYKKFDKAIVDDYNNYIQQLPLDEKNNIGPIQFFEDGAGQHAVKMEIALNGTDWAHVLIYGKDNKRLKVIKYKVGHYAC
jgi:hypothetical protein